MGFEEEFFEILKQSAIKRRDGFIAKYGTEEEMKPGDRSFYRINYKDTTRVAVRRFNDKINCGGYALEIDERMYPNESTLSRYVSSILNTFDFVRLLGDEPLKDDEYLVFYRFIDYEKNNGINRGHHFIKVGDDGLVIEKNGYGQARIFEGWHRRYDGSPEVAFAVKKDHNHYFKSGNEVIELAEGLDFSETVSKSIEEKCNLFSYHGHNYRLKKNKEGKILIVDDNDNKVADVQSNDEGISVIVDDDKIDYVENLTGPVKPIIQNGRLINLRDFRAKRAKSEKGENNR